MPLFLVNVEFKAAPEEADLGLQKAFLQQLTDEKVLLLAAQLPETPGRGIAILQAETREQATLVYGEAVLAKKGVVGWTITDLVPTFGTALQII